MTPEQERDFNERLEAMFRAHPEARAAFASGPIRRTGGAIQTAVTAVP